MNKNDKYFVSCVKNSYDRYNRDNYSLPVVQVANEAKKDIARCIRIIKSLDRQLDNIKNPPIKGDSTTQ